MWPLVAESLKNLEARRSLLQNVVSWLVTLHHQTVSHFQDLSVSDTSDSLQKKSLLPGYFFPWQILVAWVNMKQFGEGIMICLHFEKLLL